ncbi:MAG: uracil-DNA glycosylase family protein, partial [bacterium]
MRCPLGSGRNKLVFGHGISKTPLMFIGEGPGADEDAQGEPFVGRAGKLLTKMIH